MSDWIGLGFILLIVLCGLYFMARPEKPISQEEHEKRAAASMGLLSAGALGLQKILDPAAEKAVATQEDLRQGYLDGEQESGDGNDTNPVVEKMNSDTKEDGDA